MTDRENARTVIVAGIFLARPGRVRSDVGRGRDIEVQETRGDRVGHFRKRRSNSFVKDTLHVISIPTILNGDGNKSITTTIICFLLMSEYANVQLLFRRLSTCKMTHPNKWTR